MRVTFDSFAAPHQIGELHRIALDQALAGPETTDQLVHRLTGKYPHDLLREEAADLIIAWTEKFPLPDLARVMDERVRTT